VSCFIFEHWFVVTFLCFFIYIYFMTCVRVWTVTLYYGVSLHRSFLNTIYCLTSSQYEVIVWTYSFLQLGLLVFVWEVLVSNSDLSSNYFIYSFHQNAKEMTKNIAYLCLSTSFNTFYSINSRSLDNNKLVRSCFYWVSWLKFFLVFFSVPAWKFRDSRPTLSRPRSCSNGFFLVGHSSIILSWTSYRQRYKMKHKNHWLIVAILSI
jgi:hypothetical protein